MEIAPGIRREQHNSILIYTVEQVAQAALDTWLADIKEVGQHYVLFLQDFSGIPTLTPYLRHSVEGLMRHFAEAYPDVRSYVAVVVAGSYVGQASTIFLRRTNHNPNAQTRIFLSREEARQWLEDQV